MRDALFAGIALVSILALTAGCGTSSSSTTTNTPPPTSCGSGTFTLTGGEAVSLSESTATAISSGGCTVQLGASFNPSIAGSGNPGLDVNFRTFDSSGNFLPSWSMNLVDNPVTVKTYSIGSATPPGFVPGTAHMDKKYDLTNTDYCYISTPSGSVTVTQNDNVSGGILAGTISNVAAFTEAVGGTGGCPLTAISGTFSVTIQ